MRFRLYGAAGVPPGKIARVTLFIAVALRRSLLFAIEGLPSAVAAALLAYRLIYFGIPFALAATLMTGAEIRRSLSRV